MVLKTGLEEKPDLPLIPDFFFLVLTGFSWF